MTELMHNQQLWINALLYAGFVYAFLAAGGYIIDRQEEKKYRQQVKKDRHRNDKRLQQDRDELEYLYLSLCVKNFESGQDKPNSICHQCSLYKNKKCHSAVIPDTFLDDTGAMADCSCYKKQECEKGQKNNHSEQISK